jgi:dolichol-phosphate mannosyltransferase
MTEHGTAQATPAPAGRLGARLTRAARLPANWLQLARFCVVGFSGYVVNLVVFALTVEGAGLHHLAGAGLAFLVAVTNNFVWNRRWTFDARDGRRRFQAPRFLAVSVAAALVAAALLELLVSGAGAPEVPAQAAAIVAATPLSFLGNRLWAFGRAS